MRFHKVLIANRGEIACRIIRTCREMGLATVAVYSEADSDALFVSEADEAIDIGASPSAESYLVGDKIIAAAKRTGAEAIHPGYGFLSENAGFAQACEDAGLIFVGPSVESIRAMGSKQQARRLMTEHGVAVVPGYDGDEQGLEHLKKEAARIGYPVMVKASAGGGGKGMRVVANPGDFEAAVASARREASNAFADDTLLLEKVIESPRHIEFQVMGDAHGNLIHCFERECSIQRRHQKIIEETPSPALNDDQRLAMAEAALKAARALSYRSAGTVEFICDGDGQFYFLEINTRLQVEHPVTEMTTGLDLVRLQLEVAAGAVLPINQSDVTQEGHSIECRIYAEEPANGFLPTTGVLQDWHFVSLPGVRLDSGVRTGDRVSVYYDPMLAKVITHGSTRQEATRRMIRLLRTASIQGVKTNREFLVNILEHEAWVSGDLDTAFIPRHFADYKAPVPSVDSIHRAVVVGTLKRVIDRSAARTILPALPIGFRNNVWRPCEETWLIQDEEVEVRYSTRDLKHFDIAIGDRKYGVALNVYDDNRMTVSIEGHRHTVRLVQFERELVVHHSDGDVMLTHKGRFSSHENADNRGECVAPMPGKVLDVLVTVGQEVAAGDGVVILEAMKMEQTITAPRAAVVKAVLVEAGSIIDADTPLVEFEAAEDA